MSAQLRKVLPHVRSALCGILLVLGHLTEALAQGKPNVVLITIDTLRADHLGCYGNARIQTPSIDQLAREGVRFTRAFTPVPITLPAHAALLTGSYPMATGMHDFSGNKLPESGPTLAQVLRQNGWRTAAFIGAAVLDSRFGLNQGFETYFDHFDFSRLDETNLDLIERRGDLVMDEALGWLKRQPFHTGEAFFLWVHLYDPHFPYTPPEPFASRYRTHLYDGEIAFDDAQVARLIAYLKDQGLYDGSVIVLAGDHGEGLGEHGETTHGFFVYNSTLHVPLIIKIPGAKPRVVEEEISLVDLAPTVLQALKVSIPESVQGRSLLSLMLGQSGGPDSAASLLYAETYLPLLHFGWSHLRSFQSRGWKFTDAPEPELYDTRADPHELNNLYRARQSLAHEMRDRLYGLLRRYTPTKGKAVAERELTDPALLDRLRSLGYVAVSGGTITEAGGKSLRDPKSRVKVYELFSQAMADGQHGRYQESLAKLREAEKAEPDSLPIRYLQALDYFRLKDFPRALEAFKSALKLDPKFALATFYLGLTLVELNDFDGAAASFERALALDPTNFSAAYNLGATYLKKNRAEDALGAFQRAVEINPDYSRGYEAMGELYLYLKRPHDAINALERAVQLVPGFRKAHYHLGLAYQAQGREADAQREFKLAQTP